MNDLLPDVTAGAVWEVVKWLGSSAVLGGLAWFLKLPQKAWNRFQLWIIFRHANIPRRTMLIRVRAAEWFFGASRRLPGTQVHIQATVTNITANTTVEIIEVRFRRAWRWAKRPLVAGTIYVRVDGGTAPVAIAPGAVDEVVMDAFLFPRIEWENEAIDGTLYIVDQFHKQYSVDIHLRPGGGVASQVATEKQKRADGEYDADED